MLFFIITLTLGLEIGKVNFETIFPHDKRLAFIQFEQKFKQVPQVIISLVGLHINNEVPKSIGIYPEIFQITNQGFQLQITNQKTKIDHLEYQWLAIQDDSIEAKCQTISSSLIVNFGRNFQSIPTTQIFITGFSKESNQNDLKFQLLVAQVMTNQMHINLNNLSEHEIKNVQFCYLVGMHLKSKSLMNINQKTDEFVDLDGMPEELIYGVTKISNFYGALVIQLGEFQYEQEKAKVGISKTMHLTRLNRYLVKPHLNLNMKLQNIHSIDFGKANKQIKDIQLKFLQSRMLRKNKENCNPQEDTRTKLLVQTILKPFKRLFQDLRKAQQVKNLIDEVFSVVNSENCDNGENYESYGNQSIADGFKISFANIKLKEEDNIIDLADFAESTNSKSSPSKNAPIILFMLLQSVRRKHLIISFQEIKYFILRRDLKHVSYRLQNAKREQLRKIIVNKMRQESILIQVYLKYWSQQTTLLRFFEYFWSKIFHVYKQQLGNNFKIFKQKINRKQAKKKLQQFFSKKIKTNICLLNQTFINIHLQNQLKKATIQFKKRQFQLLKNKKVLSPKIFEMLINYQNQNLMQSIKILKLNLLKNKRKIKSIQFGIEDLQKALYKIEYRQVFKQLQNKQLKLKFIFQCKYLNAILRRVIQRKLLQSFRQLH